MTGPFVPSSPPPLAPAPPPRHLLSAELAMLVGCLIWGINFSVMKFALETLSPLALTAIRFAIASLVLWLVARGLEPDTPLPWPLRWRLAGLGVLGNTVYQIGFILGLQRTSAGNSALLIASTPLLTAVLGRAFGVERLSSATKVAIAVGSLGVALVVLAKDVTFSLATMEGDILTLLAVLCWAAFTHGVRGVQGRASPLRVAAWTTMGGAAPLLVLGVPAVAGQDWSAVTPATWAAVLYSALFSIVVAYVIWNRAVAQIGSSRTALLSVTVPVFAMAVAAIALRERPTPAQLAGATLILASVVLNVRATRTGAGS